MSRKSGAQTLELSAEDNAELLALCSENNEAEKKWLGGVFLRFGMENAQDALAAQGLASARRTRRRRAAAREEAAEIG